MTFYAEMAATASELLAEFGQDVTLVREWTGVYDPETGAAATCGMNSYGNGVVLDYNQRDIDGTVIRQGDQRVYLSVDVGVTPQTGDSLLIGGKTWKVMASRTLAPAGTAVIHDCQVRA